MLPTVKHKQIFSVANFSGGYLQYHYFDKQNGCSGLLQIQCVVQEVLFELAAMYIQQDHCEMAAYVCSTLLESCKGRGWWMCDKYAQLCTCIGQPCPFLDCVHGAIQLHSLTLLIHAFPLVLHLQKMLSFFECIQSWRHQL